MDQGKINLDLIARIKDENLRDKEIQKGVSIFNRMRAEIENFKKVQKYP
jgi:hypothetical protein